jgi:hypothetical protein
MPNFCGVECVCTCAVESSEHGGRGYHGGVFTQPLNELILLCAKKRVHLLAQIARNGKVSGYVYTCMENAGCLSCEMSLSVRQPESQEVAAQAAEQ